MKTGGKGALHEEEGGGEKPKVGTMGLLSGSTPKFPFAVLEERGAGGGGQAREARPGT